MKRQRKEQWFNTNGALKTKYDGDFSVIEEQLRQVFRQLEGRISYRDMYEVAHQAGASAVGFLVRNHVNSQTVKRRSK